MNRGIDTGILRFVIKRKRLHMTPLLSVNLVVDEVSDLRASDVVVPALSVGQHVLVTQSDDPKRNGIWIVDRDGMRRPPMTERAASHLSIWARNDGGT